MAVLAVEDGLQVEPPLVVDRTTGGEPLPSGAPTAIHVAPAQDNAHTAALLGGRLACCQLDPLSLVSIPSAGAVGTDSPSMLGPTAIQLDGLVQATEDSACMPPSTVFIDQVSPASLDESTVPPTATQAVLDIHVTEPRPATQDGYCDFSQVEPPSVVLSIKAPSLAPVLGTMPTDMQTISETQVADMRMLDCTGEATLFQVDPPSEVDKRTLLPTAIQ